MYAILVLINLHGNALYSACRAYVLPNKPAAQLIGAAGAG